MEVTGEVPLEKGRYRYCLWADLPCFVSWIRRGKTEDKTSTKKAASMIGMGRSEYVLLLVLVTSVWVVRGETERSRDLLFLLEEPLREARDPGLWLCVSASRKDRGGEAAPLKIPRPVEDCCADFGGRGTGADTLDEYCADAGLSNGSNGAMLSDLEQQVAR